MMINLLKTAAQVLVPLSVALTVYAIAGNQDSLPYRYYRSYVAYLERLLRSMFIPMRGSNIVLGQVAGFLVMLGVGVGGLFTFWWAVLPVVGYGPIWYINSLRTERVRAIESKMDGFILSLANALKTTPSIGNALAYAQAVAPAPMNQELLLALKEMRVGSTVDQALLNMSGRIGSAQLDATMAGMLIGRQVGGDLPTILSTTAHTLREMSRLQGVLRAKTADGRIQIGVIAFLPVVLLAGFDTVKPGYFKPLMASTAGVITTLVACAMWGAALLISHRFLKVEL